jgi:diaminopimelate decarboxylase
VIAALASAGAGLEVVSGGELFKALRAGAPAGRIVFGGVGKQEAELEESLQAGILLFNAESEEELRLLSAIAVRLGKRAPVALRVNPDVDPKTHPYIATGLREHKFGIPWERALEAYRLALSLPGLDVCGLDCHIGSQIGEAGPFEDAARRLAGLAHQLLELGCPLRLLDLGGGLGIRYADEEVLAPAAYVAAIDRGLLGSRPGQPGSLAGLRWLVEPGRALVAEAGLLLTRVLYVKRDGGRTFVITDAGMSELIRPSLYGAYHPIVPVAGATEAAAAAGPVALCDVVGPICESGDFLAQGRSMPVPRPGDLLAVLCAGAYGSAMSSRYNARPLCAEVVVRGGKLALARRRESYQDLVQHETIPELARRP